jgi:hypothetical protein
MKNGTECELTDLRHADSPEEFMEALLRANDKFVAQVTIGMQWVHRGQADLEWPLIPSALRNDAPGVGSPLPTLRRERVYNELRSLVRFYRRADQGGVDIPENSQSLRLELDRSHQNLQDEDVAIWPPTSLLSILALAQHHGVPTRLLDWTANPFVAGYFAAKGVCLLRARGATTVGKRLAVFSAIISHLDRPQRERKGLGGPTVELVRAPYAGNPNLRAQSGVFTLLRNDGLRAEEPEMPLAVDRSGDLQLHAATLSWEEAPALLYLLARLGVSAATVFPGLGGVVDSLDEEKYWPKRYLYPRAQYHSDFWTPAEGDEVQSDP